MIATDAPEKNELLEFKSKKLTKAPKVKKRILDSDSEVDENVEIELKYSISGEEIFEDEPEAFIFQDIDRNPVPDEYVLIKFRGKQSLYYAGK